MARGTLDSGQSPPDARSARLIEYECYIDQQVGKTCGNVRAVELAGALMVMLAALGGFLLIAALLDHWLVPGGLGFWSRLLLLGVLASGGLLYLLRRAVPLLLRRINPIYAAHTIECSTPSLKNSLLNFLMFRHNRTGIRPAVYQVVEEQAATRLARVAVESAVDRAPLVRLGYVLLAVVAACCLYKVLSPKDPLLTAKRVILPWADIRPPTRVRILSLEPGDTTVSRGEQVTVSADIQGTRDNEQVRLLYTTVGQQAVDREILMHVPTDGVRYSCLLPDNSAGIRQELHYRIEAGDAVSRTFRIRVTAVPTMVVERVDYDYPDYTGLDSRSVEREGDIAAIEGTRVTIHGRANSMIESAHIDFGCDGRSDRRMKYEDGGSTAVFSFTLALKQYDRYQLRLVNQAGRENRQPVQYQIEVTPDLAPEVELLAPPEDEFDVPLDGTVEVETYARDPDFALQRVLLAAAVGDRSLWQKPLLKREQPGQFVGKIRLQPKRYPVKVGDVVEIWAMAHDNKTPAANVRRSGSKRLRIVAPEHEQGGPDPSAKEGPAPDSDRSEGPDNSDQDQQGRQDGQRRSQASQTDPQTDAQQQNDPGQGQDQGAGEAGQAEQAQEGTSQGSQGQPSGEGGQRHEQDGAGQGSAAPRPESESSGQDEPGGEGVANDGADDGSVFEEVLRELGPGGSQDSDQVGDANAKHDPRTSPSEADAAPSDGTASGRPDGAAGEQPRTDRPAGAERGAGGQHDSSRTPPADRAEGQPPGQSGRRESAADARPAVNDDANTDSAESGQSQPPDSSGRQQAGDAAEDTAKGQAPEATNRPGTAPDNPPGQQPKDTVGSAPQAERTAPQQSSARDSSKSEGSGRQSAADSAPDPQQGPAGAGASEPVQGSPEPQTDIRPRDKASPADSQPTDRDQAAQSPAHGKTESDSRGAEGGDKPGGGREGGGQKSDRQGTGSAGQNTAAEDGSGSSDDAGSGDPTQAAGQDAPADRPTGGPAGQTPGAGSRPRPGSADAKPKTADQSDQPGSTAAPGSSGASGQPAGGDRAGAAAPPPPPPATEPGGDQANLEYARKATALVLEHLKDQLAKDQIDPKLLEKLGWSREDLERFVRRWQTMYQQARTAGEDGTAARGELDDALRSLGLTPDRIFRRARQTDDQTQRLREGLRSSPPPEYQRQLKAYLKGTSRAAMSTRSTP